MRGKPAGNDVTPVSAEAERRLRAALEAQAGTVRPGDLRRAEPPSAAERRHRWPSLRPVRFRATALTLSGLVAALVCVVLLVPVLDRQHSEPAAPASPTASDGPSRTPAPADPSPEPVPPPASAPERPGHTAVPRPAGPLSSAPPGPVTRARAAGPTKVTGTSGLPGASEPSHQPGTP